MYKMDHQQGTTVQDREFCSKPRGSLDRRGIWGRTETCVCMAESTCSLPETITTLLTCYECLSAKSLQSCPTLCNPMDCGPPGSSVHGLFQVRKLKWVAMPFSRDLSDPGIKPASLTSPVLAGRFFTTSTIQESAIRQYKTIIFFKKKDPWRINK